MISFRNLMVENPLEKKLMVENLYIFLDVLENITLTKNHVWSILRSLFCCIVGIIGMLVLELLHIYIAF